MAIAARHGVGLAYEASKAKKTPARCVNSSDSKPFGVKKEPLRRISTQGLLVCYKLITAGVRKWAWAYQPLRPRDPVHFR
jgi:hypothetical protein